MAMQYEEVGMREVARKGFDYLFQWQQPDGRFDCAYDGRQSPQFDGNGQALWSLWQYYKITGDKQWMTEHYPKLRKAVDWIIASRKKADAAAPGLLPPAPADGENLWDGKHHIVGYDFWNLRGLLYAADVARLPGKSEEAEEIPNLNFIFREGDLGCGVDEVAEQVTRSGRCGLPNSGPVLVLSIRRPGNRFQPACPG